MPRFGYKSGRRQVSELPPPPSSVCADTVRDGTPELELLELAWGVIANAGWDGMEKTAGWQEAAVRWRDQYFALSARLDG